jgi:CBS domain-containing protein
MLRDTPSDDLFGMLVTTPLETLLKSKLREIISVSEETTLNKAMAVLAENQILSVPVYTADSKEILGLVDILDIVKYIFATVSPVKYATVVLKTEFKWEDIKFNPAAFTSDQIRNAKIKDVLDFSLKDKKVLSHPFPEKKDLPQAVTRHCTVDQLMELFEQGTHRVPVINDTTTHHFIDNIVSESDILTFITDNISTVQGDDRFTQTIEKLKLGTNSVISMPSSALAIHGFFLMYVYRIPAVAIVDSVTGELIANLSASDIRGLTTDTLDKLLVPVTSFITGKEPARAPHWEAVPDTVGRLSIRPKMIPPITCTYDTTFSVVIQKLNLYRLHRIWIVDRKNKPTGVITLTHIMKQLRVWLKHYKNVTGQKV